MHESEVSESVYLSELILMDCVLSDCRLTPAASTPPPSQQSYAPPSPLLVTSPRIFPFPSPVLITDKGVTSIHPARASQHLCGMITDNKGITFSGLSIVFVIPVTRGTLAWPGPGPGSATVQESGGSYWKTITRLSREDTFQKYQIT